MIAIVFLAAMQAAQPTALTSFVCQADNGRSFSVDVVETAAGSRDARERYRVSGLEQADIADQVMDSLPEFLMLTWTGEDGGLATLEIEDFDAEMESAKFRLAIESAPSAPIVTKSFSNGRCLSRVVSTGQGETAGATAQ